jgi:hypothetical protein
MNKKAQTSVNVIIAVTLILAGVAFLINYPVLGYVLGGLGLIIESIIKIVTKGLQ